MSLYSQVIILIGNKADLEAQRDVTYEEAKQFAEENGEPDTEQRMLGWQEKGVLGGGNGFPLHFSTLLDCLTSTL